MKELSIEEKAKAYDEAIEKLRSLHDDYDTVSTLIDVKEELENIFPALKESEDERVRKELVQFFKEKDEEDFREWIPKAKVLAWLEKQGEQKPKFRIGDTIKKKSTGDIVTISEIDLKNREYRLSNTGFIPFKYEHLWELVEQKPAEWHREDEKAIAANGYMWDAEKRELTKVRQEDLTRFESRLCEILDCAMRNPVDNPNTIIFDVKKKLAPELLYIARDTIGKEAVEEFRTAMKQNLIEK